MKVSVIIPVYKVEKYLRQCVDSVLGQSYKDIEVILVDDGSPDTCPQICDEYAAIDSRVKVVHKPNGGLSSARNAGMEHATGDYVAFVDSDDYWDDPEALKDCADACERQGLDVLLFGFKKFFQNEGQFETVAMDVTDDMLNSPQDLKTLLSRNVFVTSACNKIVRSSLLDGDSKIRFREGQLSEDIEYCTQIILHADTYGVINKNFYVYRQQNPTSISSNIGRKNLTDIAVVIKRYVDVARDADADKKVAIYNYLALQYVLWLTVSNLVPKSEINDVLSDMKQYWWLLANDWCPYVKKVKPLRFLGFSIIRKLLHLYKRTKK